MSAIPCLHLPVDFERRASVRLLIRKVNEIAQHSGHDHSEASIILFAIRIWMDWAVGREEWRPLYREHPSVASVQWAREELSYIIENSVQWPGTAGDLISSALSAKFITLSERGGKWGLILDGFWELNQHLSRDFRSIQSRGGRARAEKRYEAEAIEAAAARKEIFDSQGILPFGSEQPSEEEQRLCYALFFRLHRVCNLNMPLAADFLSEAMVDALNVIRKYTPDEIAQVESYLMESRDTPAVVKVPTSILKNFAQYLDAADHR